MSINSEITRLSGAKTSLANKMDTAGYTGLTGKKIDQLVDMLDLSSGGGGIVVTEEQDSHGGKVLHISGEELRLQSKPATPSETAQEITPDTGYTGLSKVNVGAVSSTYVGSGVTRQAAKTVTPTKSQQTAVASGVYTTGAVTVGAIPSQYIVPSGGVTITENGTTDVTDKASVTVAIPFHHIYVGTGAPSASLGEDGDIYLQIGG